MDTKYREKSDGGDVTQGEHNSKLTEYTEYNRHKGSDGFSKNGGNVRNG